VTIVFGLWKVYFFLRWPYHSCHLLFCLWPNSVCIPDTSRILPQFVYSCRNFSPFSSFTLICRRDYTSYCVCEMNDSFFAVVHTSTDLICVPSKPHSVDAQVCTSYLTDTGSGEVSSAWWRCCGLDWRIVVQFREDRGDLSLLQSFQSGSRDHPNHIFNGY
jgi:hypothetical protein